MAKNIEIRFENSDKAYEFPLGTTLGEIAHLLSVKTTQPIMGAFVNHRAKPLDYEMVKPRTVQFIDYSWREGQRMYLRTLSFILYAAVRNLWPDAQLKIDHAISKGYYCEIEGLERVFTEEDVWSINDEMRSIINQDMHIDRKMILAEKAIELLEKNGLLRKAELYRNYGRLYAPIFFLGDHVNFFYGHMLTSTGFVQHFGVEKYYDGFLLRFPIPTNLEVLEPALKQDKLFAIFREHKKWADILEVEDIPRLNAVTKAGRYSELIKISEALHEKKIVEISTAITDRKDKVNIVLIAGPSSSGKTTFSRRLGIQLAVNGLHTIEVSIDDFFVSRDLTPKDDAGNYDFEALEAIDIPYFNDFLLRLTAGEEVEVPRFDFHQGERTFSGKTMKMEKDNILIIEGIHGLNPGLTPKIDPEKTFRIFVSALTQISIDEHTYIPTTDNRLLRRITRDSKYRGYDALTTIQRWPSVRRGEDKHIFPYQENADIMFNSALIYELAVIKKHAAPLLKQVKENTPEYSEAVRLLIFISYFETIPEEEIPPTSVLREFLGGSSFLY
ncbi:MAG: nucleoside kinase [Bacteroidia bacterium]|nr:nucleoside kinase [Bacteroidia bacterium]